MIELAIHLATMGFILFAAIICPVKTVDRVKARSMTLPRESLTVGELKEPQDHGPSRPTLYYSISAPDNLIRNVVRFQSREPTVGQFIAAIESQTPLRHKFRHCGNGSSILWGGDCSFGLWFRVPGEQ